MKVKEIERTANVAWSPGTQYPVYMACGTAAQQLDATFSTKSAMEIFRFNPEDTDLECELVAAAETEHRFNKVVWGNLGMDDGAHSSGVVVGGTDKGVVCVWDASKLIMQESDSQILSLTKHNGNVGSLDFNKFQDNLLASGGSDSEIYLWDLNNPTTPMTPGAKSQPSDDVTCLSWNCQVQHILASALNTRCVVWDLRKSEPIIKISDSMSRIKPKQVTWHPQVATQLVLSSEDDHAPVIQLWDLRFAASPLKVLERHERGVLSMAWSRRDPDLLISCGKDNRLICWNPNTDVVGGEVTYEFPMGNQWCFDVQWCPRNPQCLSACSYDGRVTVYSIMGGEMVNQPMRATNKIADSFGGFDNMASTHTVPKVEKQIIPQIAKAPKWLKRPCGASFSFGGRLVSFSPSGQNGHSLVTVHKVVTEPEIVAHSTQLEHALHNRQFAEFCSLKIANCEQERDETLWQFLKVNFESDPRSKYLSILGFDAQEISQKVSAATSSGTDLSESELSSKMSALSSAAELTETNHSSAACAFDQISQPDTAAKEVHFNSADTSSESLLTQALLTGNFEQAVELCLCEGRMADAIILANADGPALLTRTMKRYFQRCTGSTSSLISAVVQKDYRSIIDNASLDNWKEALAVILTYSNATEFVQLCDKLGSRLELCGKPELSSNAVLCYICSGNIEKFVECWIKQTPELATSSMALQELIEKVMMLRRAVEQLHGQEYSISAGSSLANKLGKYSELLAAEGNLQTALGYLTGVSQSQKLSVLKHRLQIALGQHVTTSPWPRVELQASQHHQPKQPVRSANPYGNAAQHNTSQYQPAHAQPTPSQKMSDPTVNPYQNGSLASSTPAYNTYNGAGAYATATSSYGGYGAPTSVYQPTQPLGSTYGQPTAPVSTYPSASAPTYPSAPAPTYPSAPASTYQPQPYASSTGYSSYGQAQPVGHVAARGLLGKKYASASTSSTSESSQPSPCSVGQPAQSYYNPNAANISLDVTANMAGSYNAGNVYNPTGPLNAATSMTTAASYQQYQPPAAPAVPIPTVDAARNAPSGWNDPPPVHGKEPESPKTTAKSTPITMPVFNPAGQPGMMGGDTMHAGQQQQYGGVVGQPQQQQRDYYSQQQQQQQQQYAPAPISPKQPAPAPVAKAPIPEKHIVLKDTLNLLANKCLHASSNPQQKRKLEDVLKKLEYLYDKLRNEALSEAICTGLHQIVASVKQYDYQAGLAIHTHMVSQGNFSEISAFMPGLKMLMQTAYQLQVFV